MTPAEYRTAIAALGLNQASAARFFEAAPATGPRWAKHGPPTAVAMMLRLMIEMRLTPDDVDIFISR